MESDNGSLYSLRQFNRSVRSSATDENDVFIGANGHRYNGVLINIPPWWGHTPIGVEYYLLNGDFPVIQTSNVWSYLWEDDVPVKEQILMDFANTSGAPISLTVTIEPLCERVPYEPPPASL